MRNFLVLALISIACMQLVSGHAYFESPVPRMPYCFNSTCVNGGTTGAQGPVWQWPSGQAYNADTVTATSCGTAGGIFAAAGFTAANPGAGTIMATWTGGSTANVQIFISETHTFENTTQWPATDGWEIRYRDATSGTSNFAAFTVNTITGTGISVTPAGLPGTGPFPSANFVQGGVVIVNVAVPNLAYSDMEIQFIWSQSNLHPGNAVNSAMWLSCADVAVTSANTPTPAPTSPPNQAYSLASSSLAMFIPALLLVLVALF